MAVLTVHALGEPCPAPVVKATRALQQMTEPGVVEVHVDNEAAVQNLGRMAAGRGLTVTNETLAEGHFVVRIEAGAAQAAEKPSGAPPQRGTRPAARWWPSPRRPWVRATTRWAKR